MEAAKRSYVGNEGIRALQNKPEMNDLHLNRVQLDLMAWKVLPCWTLAFGALVLEFLLQTHCFCTRSRDLEESS